jgi:hypothetical protein
MQIDFNNSNFGLATETSALPTCFRKIVESTSGINFFTFRGSYGDRRTKVYGSWSESRYSEKLQSFELQLKKDNVKTVGGPSLARYNSPFQLWFLRRNEIWFEVE